MREGVRYIDREGERETKLGLNQDNTYIKGKKRDKRKIDREN